MSAKSIDAKTAELVRGLARDADSFAQPVQKWYGLFPQSFYRIASDHMSPGKELIAFSMMAEDPECCRLLCDPGLLSLHDALALARNLRAIASDLDVRLARAAVEWVAEKNRRNSLRRCLTILHSLDPGPRINGSLVQLLGAKDGAVRSMVFELLIRNSFNERNIRTWLQDRDPRIRANIVEFLSRTHPAPDWVRDVLLECLKDPHGRTAANAAVELFRTGGEAEARAQLAKMALSENFAVRSSAAWAMGQIPEAAMGEILNVLRSDRDSRVRWHALKSLSRVHKTAVKLTEVKPPEETIPVAAEVAPEPEPPPPPAPAAPEPRAFHTKTFGRLL